MDLKKQVKTLLFFPYFLLKVFSQDKSFGKNPIIGNYFLNRLGLHILRLLVAHFITKWRHFVLCMYLDKEQRLRYKKDGYLIFKNFLPDTTFEAIQNEFLDYSGETHRYVQGDTATEKVQISPNINPCFPTTHSLLGNKNLLCILRYCSATLDPCLVYFQAIRHHIKDGKSDPQKKLHIDTFHPTMKAWLYLVDVSKENGPFYYVPGSNKLTWKRISWEYKKSLENSKSKTGGAFRASNLDMKKFGFGEPIPILVPANTLIVANTFGLHCRGDAEGQRSRFEIWFHSRTNPFNPTIGGIFLLFRSLHQKLVDTAIKIDIHKGKIVVQKADWQASFQKEIHRRKN